MRRIKMMLCMLLVLFLSGCTGEYNLIINDNNSITEDISFREEISIIETYSTVNSFLNSEYNLIKKDGRYNNYDINTNVKDEYAYGNGKKEYKNFNNFKKNSIIVTEMFKDILLTRNDNIVEINLVPKETFKYFEESTQYSALLEKVVFKVTLPYKVIEGNYDEVENNTYIWNITKDDLRKINIKYQEELIILEKNKEGLIIIGSILVLLLIITFVIFVKNKRNNRY